MPSLNPERCAILVPIGGQLDPETHDSLCQLTARGYKVRTLRGSSMIDLARSTLASDVLAEGFEETFWIDSDTVFNPDDVDRIRSHGKPFCVGLYVQKGPKRFAGKFKQDTGKVRFGKDGGLVEMQYVGMGFTYVHSDVYRAIKERMPLEQQSCRGGYAGRMVTAYFLPLLAPEGNGTCYLSEDYSFTHRATAAGFPPLADTTVKLGHAGRKVYTWDDLLPSQTLDSLEIDLCMIAGWTFPQDVRGWLTDEEGAGLALLARGKDVLEVGSYCGRSSICLGQTAKSLCCVDPFDCRDTPGDGDTFGEFSANLARYGVKARVQRSLFADAYFNGDRFDLIFIDGAHDEASVKADATRARSLLKPDGLLAFHDARPSPGYHDGGWHPGVTATVNRLVAQGAEIVHMAGTIAVIRPKGKQ
jgi:predicted O-methyltransferase YrrM